VVKHHPWGSHNWSRPLQGEGVVGELPDAPRTWHNGTKPAGACGQVPPTPVACSQFRTDWNLTCTFTAGTSSSVRPMQWEPPIGAYQAAIAFTFGTCQRWVVGLSCLPGPPDQLRITVNAGLLDQPATILDDIRLSFTDSPDIFPIEVSCPNVSAGCLGAGGGECRVQIVQNARIGRSRGLSLV